MTESFLEGPFQKCTEMSDDGVRYSENFPARQSMNFTESFSWRSLSLRCPWGGRRSSLGRVSLLLHPRGLLLPIRPEGAPPPPLQGHRDSLSEEPEAEREAPLASPSSGWGGSSWPRIRPWGSSLWKPSDLPGLCLFSCTDSST